MRRILTDLDEPDTVTPVINLLSLFMPFLHNRLVAFGEEMLIKVLVRSSGGNTVGVINATLDHVFLLTSYRWNIDANEVRKDLTAGDGRPQWILSAYSPSRNCPASLLEAYEVSFEEIRQQYYDLRSNGNEAQAANEAMQIWSKAEQEITQLVQNAGMVVSFMQQKEKSHPNRYDFLKMTGNKSRDQIIKEAESSGPMGQIPSSGGLSGPGFGQSSQSGFGQPSFGQPSFGQPSGPFNQSTTQSPFSKATGPAFGQPSFGQPSQPSGGFGQPSEFGNKFGAPSNPLSAPGPGPSNSSPFSGASNASSLFGQQPQQPSTFGNVLQAASTFTQPPQSAPTFDQPSQPSASFGKPPQPVSGFGQPSQPTTASDAAPAFRSFGASQDANKTSSNLLGTEQTSTGGFGQSSQAAPPSSSQQANQSFKVQASEIPPSAPSTTTSSSDPHPLTSKPPTPIHYSQSLGQGNTSHDPSTQRLTSYRSCPVRYINDSPCYQRPDGKGWERIWFPNAPDNVRLEDVHVEDQAAYNAEAVQTAYRRLAQTGKFELRKVPTVPPKREWVGFDF